MTAVSIRQSLANTLAGYETPLTWDEVSAYLRRNYVDNQGEKDRCARHQRRQDLYTDNGVDHLKKLIGSVFMDPDVRALRCQWAESAMFNNFIKRVVNELSCVYQQPATRHVGMVGSDDDVRYQAALGLARIDERARQWNRLTNLHRAALVMFRVRSSDMTPAIDIVTPGDLFLVCDPADPTRKIAVGIRLASKYARGTGPAWLVWSEAERFHLDAAGRIIEGSLVANPYGRIPGSFVTLEPPTSSLWPGDSGEDLVSAHLAIAFSNVCALKETKTAAKILGIFGDSTMAARKQAMEPERPVEMPDGVSAQVLDLTMNTAIYTAMAGHVEETTASTYGMNASILRHQGVQSAAARDLMRVPLRELRLEQQTPLRAFERDFAEVMAAVLAVDRPDLAFDTDGWRIDFADPQTPLSVKEQLEVFEQRRRLTLDSTLAYIVRENPDIDRDQAADDIQRFIADELWRNEQMRPLQEIAGTPGATTPDVAAAPAADNGKPAMSAA